MLRCPFSLALNRPLAAEVTGEGVGLAGEFGNAQKFTLGKGISLLELALLVFVGLGQGHGVIGAVVANILPDGRLEAAIAEGFNGGIGCGLSLREKLLSLWLVVS